MLSVFPDQVLWWLLVYHIIFIMFKYVPSICFFGAFIIKWWTLPKAFSHLLVWPCDVCICSVWAHLRVLDRSCVWWSETDVRYRLLTSFHCISEGHSQLHHLSLNLDFTFSITVADQGATGLSYFLPFPSQPLELRWQASCHAFHMGMGISTQVLMLKQQGPYALSHISPQPGFCL